MTATIDPAPNAGPDPLRAPLIATFGDSSQRVLVPRWMVLLGLILGQVVLTRVMMVAPIVGQLVALAIIGLIVYAGIQRSTPLLLCVAAYLPGAEIAWRQVGVALPYLIAPYLLIVVSLVGVLTSHKQLTKPGRTALLYFALLLPAVLVTYTTTGGNARKLIAFGMAGPAALALLVVLCSQLTIVTALYRRLLWILVISGLGPLTVALTLINEYIVNVGELEFTTESNFLTSGGFGPVQVSSLMGLTVLAALLLFLAEREFVPRLFAILIGGWAMVQSLLTFSRGGMIATAIAIAGLTLSQATDRRNRNRVLGAVAAAFAIGWFLIIPQVDAFTKGKLNERFSETTTGRTTLASGDFEIFLENPAFGVGPGMSKYRRLSFEICQLRQDRCNFEGSSHTEFTRMPAEHGIAGVIAIGLMVALSVQALRRAGPSLPLTITMLLWALAQMVYANLRIAAVPVVFAFAFLRVRSPDDLGDEPPPDADESPPVGLHTPR